MSTKCQELLGMVDGQYLKIDSYIPDILVWNHLNVTMPCMIRALSNVDALSRHSYTVCIFLLE